MKIAVIGANGQLGSDLVVACVGRGHEVIALTHEEIRVEDESSVRSVLLGSKPDAVLNSAASHNVPHCEQDPGKSFAVNALGALYVARTMQELGGTAVYYSTDYVFDGEAEVPYAETAVPGPVNVYGVTKLAGEHLTLAYCRKGIVARVSAIYGRVPCRAKGGNFITTMVKAAAERPVVRVVDDEIVSPTPTEAVAERTLDLLDAGVSGLFHMAGNGQASWFDFARVIFDRLGLSTPLEACSVTDFPSPVRRPLRSALVNAHLREAGFGPMPDWRAGVEEFLRKHHGSRG
jgi:dTDP-4-dehydrorhamnose reductase